MLARALRHPRYYHCTRTRLLCYTGKKNGPKCANQRPTIRSYAKPKSSMTSLLQSSFTKLESFLDQIHPIPTDKEDENFDVRRFEIEFEDQMKPTIDIREISPDVKRLAHECMDESFALSAPNRYQDYQQLCESIKRKGLVSQRMILNFILNANSGSSREFKWTISARFTVFQLCYKYGFHQTGCLALKNQDIKLDHLLNKICDGDSNKESSLGKFLIGIHMYNQTKDPQLILDSQLCQPDYIKFRYCYFLYMKSFATEAELDNSWKYWKDSLGMDTDVYGIHLLRKIDFLKSDPKKCLDANVFKKFITTMVTSKSTHDLSVIINHMLNLSNEELIKIDPKDHKAYLRKLNAFKVAILEHIIQLKRWKLDPDLVRLLITQTPLQNNKSIGDYIASNNYPLKNLDRSWLFQSALFERLINLMSPQYLEQTLCNNFNQMTEMRKREMMQNAINSLITHDNDKPLIKVLTSMTDQEEYGTILRKVMNQLYIDQPMNQIIKFLKITDEIGTIVDMKDCVFTIMTEIMRKQHKLSKETNLERYSGLLTFLISHQNSRSSKGYIWRLVPYLIHMSTSLPYGQRSMKQLKMIFNITIDHVCYAPRLLYILNPMGYPSGIYIQSKDILTQLANTLFKDPKATYPFMLELISSRHHWLSKDPNDGIKVFSRKMFKYGVFLEVFSRLGIRQKFYEDLHNLPSLQHGRLDNRKFDKEMIVAGKHNIFWELARCEQRVNEDIEQEQQGKPLGYCVKEILAKLESNGKNQRIEKYHPEPLDSSPHQWNLEDIDREQEEEENDEGNRNSVNIKSSPSLRDEMDIMAEIYSTMKQLGLEGQQNASNTNNDTSSQATSFPERSLASDVDSASAPAAIDENTATRKYGYLHKMKMVEIYSYLRLSSKMYQWKVFDNPYCVDEVMFEIFEQYDYKPPVTLIQSVMIGIIQSKKINFSEKMNLIKGMDKIVTIVYYDINHSQTFKLHVRFAEYKISLVNLVMIESERINGGDLKTLNWAMKRIINMDNLSKYKRHLGIWQGKLRNMKATRTGFWSDNNRWE